MKHFFINIISLCILSFMFYIYYALLTGDRTSSLYPNKVSLPENKSVLVVSVNCIYWCDNSSGALGCIGYHFTTIIPYFLAKAGRPPRTYIQQLCEDMGCCPEDLPKAMNDRDEWRERVRDIRATSAI